MGIINLKTTKEEKLQMVDLYNYGYSTPELAKTYGMYSNAISGNLTRRGVKLRPHTEAHRKYWINEDFFDVIDTEEKAYILGLFYADGSNNVRRYKAYIHLAEQDRDILFKIREILQPEKPLLFQNRNKNNPNHQNSYMLYIDNKHISLRLEELGCVTNKTHKLTFPKWLDYSLHNHFIRGYFDGDGHIGIYNRKGRLSIEGTESLCNSLKCIFLKELGIRSVLYTRHPERNNNIRSLRITGNVQIKKILSWLYKDATIYMERKHRKYLELEQIPKFKTGRKKKIIETCKKQIINS